MCVAVPMKVTKLMPDDYLAEVDMYGARLETVSTMLLPEPLKEGDYVIVHAGFAIHRVDEDEAQKTLDALRRIAASSPEAGFDVKGRVDGDD
jgi:hydrogenase expression/formation protein HypC